ncbi:MULTISPECIES: EAL domain-containing protein [unclassified Vibrio]|uniref:EAL domain-containing protein n=1 Tax=Vibrio sp. HB236076 TaxID=3232307 RepID=A0AB39HBJ9_9VIBR|nr:EAL domain-containing protein [Vibrio sp. HB161653]MDP5253914.1 EAL domain-containing protein [Vibrio sp. HB161653]
MYDVFGFSWHKIKWLAAFQVTFTVVAIFWLHLTFAIEFSSLASVMTIGGLFAVSTFSLLIAIQRYVHQNTSIAQTLLDSVGDVVVFKDYDGKFLYGNKTVADLYQTTPEAMVGKDDFDFTHNKEQADFLRNNVQGIMTRFEKENVYESSTDVNTGEHRCFHSIKIPFRDINKQLKILVIAKDITEISQLKEQAERNKKRLEHVLDVSQEGLWEWNTQTNEVLHNAQWESITGIKRSDNSFQEFEQCILAEDRASVFQALDELVKHNRPYNIEFRMQKPDGNIIWVWDRGQVAEFDQDNKPLWLAGIVQDITNEKQNQQKIQYYAYHDQLTGLINRVKLDIELNQVIKDSVAQNTYSALMFIDLDRFKLLNDSYGHHMGDMLLQNIAQRITQVLAQRTENQTIVARFGGDEFVAVLPLISNSQQQATAQTQAFADEIIAQISKTFRLTSKVQQLCIEYAITASIGGVVFKSDQHTAGEILQLADTALYHVKSLGGHNVKICDITLQNEFNQTSELQKSMHKAITRSEFTIYLQPKFDGQERIIGAEALVRWVHPELGVLSPFSFINIAEESNLILLIGDQVINQACQQLKQWQQNPTTEHLELAVNLSAKQIWQKHFVEDFIELVEEHQIDHSKLIVEVTESVLIQDIDDATEKLTRLKQYGISVSLDDFGTGYSSLNYLRSLPIDEIKIDRSFINDVTESAHAHLMVKSIVDLARNFKLRVVSEGVEEKEQLNLLNQLGIDRYQGFYFSKPIDKLEMDQLIQNHFSTVKTNK